LRPTPPDIAVVGVGRWGLNLARNLVAMERVRALADIDPARRAVLAGLFPALPCHVDLDAALTDPAIRAVVLATPPDTHAALALAALRAGRDVFVEKPLAASPTEARVLLDEASAHGRILMVGHLMLYHPAVAHLKALIEAGALGPLRTLEASRRGPTRSAGESDILATLATHDISLMVHLLGASPVAVEAVLHDAAGGRGGDIARASLHFPGGVVGHLDASWVHPVKERRLVVVGAEGSITFDDLGPAPLSWHAHAPGGAEPPMVTVDAGTPEPLRLECEAFVAAVDGRRAPLTDGAEGLRVLEVIEALKRSVAGDGRRVEL